MQLVTREQATALRDLGFDWETNYFFSCENNPDGEYSLKLSNQLCNFNLFPDSVSAPTVALALKWCRDVKKIISSGKKFTGRLKDVTCEDCKHIIQFFKKLK